LDCCAGRAPHAAGSCMDGTCYAALRKRANPRHRFQTQIVEHLCGLSLHARRRLSLGSTSEPLLKSTNTEGKRAPHLSITINKPCLPDCGGIGSSFASSDYRGRAVVGCGQQFRPNTASDRANGYLAPRVTRTASLRQHRSRAPPVSFL
jgi:hypothetical protein